MEVLLLNEGKAEPEPKGRLANYEKGVWKTEKQWRDGYVYHKMKDAAHDVGFEWRGPSEGSLAGCRAILAIYDYLNKSGG